MGCIIDTFWFRLASLSVSLFISLLSLSTFSSDSLFEEVGIPEGFDLLATPQTTVVDIYYGGRFLNEVRAEYTAETLEFMNPDKVIQMIPGIKDSPLLTEVLSGSLDRHNEFICDSDKECPVYKPDVAGIVFDESRFRVMVTINPVFLAPAQALSDRYLPPSTSGLSFFQSLNLAFAGSRSSSDASNNETWAMSGRSLVSIKEQSIESFWNYDEKQKLGIQSLSLNQDKNGLSYGVGLIQSQSFGLTFTSDKIVLGGRIGSSLRTLLDNGITQSTRLEIFRAQRGLVEVFRDGRLIHSEFQEAGNQLINTESFPSGAYDITIKVFYDNILNQEETQFFVKTTYLPPSDEPQFFFEAGKPVYSISGNVWPSEQDNILLRSGYNWRISEASGMSISAAGTKDELLSELSLLKLGKRYQLGTSFMMADRQRFGLSAFGDFYLKNASLNISYRRLWSDPLNLQPSEQEFLLLGDGFYQGSISLSLPVNRGSLNLRRSYNRTDTSKEQKVLDGISFSQSLGQFSGYDLRLQSSLSKDKTRFKIEFGIELSQKSNYWNTRLSYQAFYNENNQSTTDYDNHYRASTTWYDKDTFIDKVEVNGFTEKQDDKITFGAGTRYSGRYLDSTLTINQVQPDDGDTVTSYSGAVSASLFTDGDQIILGGNNHSESGLLIKLDGQEKGYFDIIVNGQKQGYGSVGNSTLINLSAFNSYTVSIRSRGESHFEYDQREYEFTLYPGNVQSYTWKIEKVLVIIGQLLDSNGEPLTNINLHGAIEKTVTDESGFFQARINAKVQQLTVDQSNGEKCVFDLPDPLNIRRGVALVGVLNCI